MKSFVVGIAGGTGSGKTTIARMLAHHFGAKAVIVAHDSYYRDQSDLTLEERVKTNYDHPASLETTLLIAHLKKLMKGIAVNMPVYDFTQHNRSQETVKVKQKKILIIEGIHVFTEEKLRELMDLKIFVDTDADIRLGRRIVRDIRERGRTLEFSLNQYLTMSKPMHEAFVEPSKRFADIIIPEGGHNTLGVAMIIKAISHANRE
jgi:uridine kinase